MLRNILGPDIDLCLDQILTFNVGQVGVILLWFLLKPLFLQCLKHKFAFKTHPNKLETLFTNTTALTEKMYFVLHFRFFRVLAVSSFFFVLFFAEEKLQKIKKQLRGTRQRDSNKQKIYCASKKITTHAHTHTHTHPHTHTHKTYQFFFWEANNTTKRHEQKHNWENKTTIEPTIHQKTLKLQGKIVVIIWKQNNRRNQNDNNKTKEQTDNIKHWKPNQQKNESNLGFWKRDFKEACFEERRNIMKGKGKQERKIQKKRRSVFSKGFKGLLKKTRKTMMEFWKGNKRKTKKTRRNTGFWSKGFWGTKENSKITGIWPFCLFPKKIQTKKQKPKPNKNHKRKV